jgi:hypothetical protein
VTPGPFGAEPPATAPDRLSRIVDGNLQLLAPSLSCGLTRVATMQVRSGENDFGAGMYGFLGFSEEHHLATHTPAQNRAPVIAIQRYDAEAFARLLDLLDGTPEGDGTLLDHTMVVWTSELGNAQTHGFKDVPFVVAGGGAGGVRLGWVHRFDATSPDRFHHRLWVGAAHFMGRTDIAQVGSLARGSGPRPGFFA